MATSHKKQHVVPASYLGAWADPASPAAHEPSVHLWTKDGKSKSQKSPVKIFREPDVYTIRSAGGERDLQLEHTLGATENAFAIIRRDFLANRLQMAGDRFSMLMLFVAVMHSRTVEVRDRHLGFWKGVLSKLEMMEDRWRSATPEEKKRFTSLPSTGARRSMGKADVRKLTEETMPRVLVPMTLAEMKYLPFMRSRVLCANGEKRFITSDTPVTWFNPDAYKKPPAFRSPGISNPSLEITMPLAPRQLLLITHPEEHPPHRDRTREGTIEYLDVNDEVVATQNRLLRLHCYRHFVTDSPDLDPVWFEDYPAPDDAWEVLNPREAHDDDDDEQDDAMS